MQKFFTNTYGITSLSKYYDNSWYDDYQAQRYNQLQIFTNSREIQQYSFEKNPYKVLTIYRKLISPGTEKADGVIVLNIRSSYIDSSLNTLATFSDQSILIIDKNDNIVSANRSFGAAYQFVPPMSITLGLKECLSARKVRLYSDTGTWKQTALRVALFSNETTEYPMTLLQSRFDALITATYETASHPISENPEWEFEGVNV